MASVDLRLTRLEAMLNRRDEVPASIVLSANGIHDADGRVIDLPASSGGVRSVVLRRGPEPAATRLAPAPQVEPA